MTGVSITDYNAKRKPPYDPYCTCTSTVCTCNVDPAVIRLSGRVVATPDRVTVYWDKDGRRITEAAAKAKRANAARIPPRLPRRFRKRKKAKQ